MALFLFTTNHVRGQELPYLCELGLVGGAGYYVGDAAPHIFMHPREAYGLLFRYKFTKRWALQTKCSGQRITGYDIDLKGKKMDSKWENQLINLDVMAEFNFFRFGADNEYDKRIKPYTPYIFLGIGIGMHNAEWLMGKGPDIMGLRVTGYVPLGIGFKWKFADFVGLNVAWQHNIYFTDNLEGREPLSNKYGMNGSNWMNCDVTGMLTAGIVFEFARAPKPCRICNW